MPEIDALLLPYLAEHPPTHILVAAFLGVGKGRGPPPELFSPPSVAEAMQAVGPGFAERDVLEGLAGCTVDFAELARRHHG